MWLEELSKIKFRKALANYYREDIAEASLKIEILANEEMNEKARWLRKLQSCFGSRFSMSMLSSQGRCQVAKRLSL
jgi:hypothetical protein